jgi:hypothetical protein
MRKKLDSSDLPRLMLKVVYLAYVAELYDLLPPAGQQLPKIARNNSSEGTEPEAYTFAYR